MANARGLASLEELFYGSVTVGERGQVVIPADARKTFRIEPGDKLLVFRHPHHPGLVLARVDDVQALLTEVQQMSDALSELASKAADEE
jgi:AbrB family looped-hinge helix DNA binding protein